MLRGVSFETLKESDWASVDRVWEALEDGEIGAARERLAPLLAARRNHPDVRIVDAAVLIEEGHAADALERLAGAERSADPALYFHLRALAAYDLSRFEAAVTDAERALAIQPGFAEAHDLLSRALEHLGRDEEAGDHAEFASELDPERFPAPLEIADAAFDALVEKALAELPPRVQRELGELPVIVDALPSRELLTAEPPPLSPDILGLFVGEHLMDRTVNDSGRAPGSIHLFKRNLLRSCTTPEELEEEVRITLQHEVGHLLGLDEDDLEQWGLA